MYPGYIVRMAQYAMCSPVCVSPFFRGEYSEKKCTSSVTTQLPSHFSHKLYKDFGLGVAQHIKKNQTNHMHSLIRENISLQAHMSSLRYPRDGAIVPQMSEPAELATQSSSPVCVGNGDARESRNAGHTLRFL